MTTTIQIREETLDLLKRIKESSNAKSYDETIINVLSMKTKTSLAGFLGKKPMKKILDDLRDKHDRI
ncbi:hypothetical protein COV18_07460 [Candidatus Woesearchaeota archaeon CG10_big_fil_rev_8_21_14_0_10_37_12]|nr:MAG: hypothetical protein COV18_07460 [Candidatus Woesearchaeota archaeon CG10_big_fil_rev_8_21_14_0_10_37_12]